MKRTAANLFQQPAEMALSAVLADSSARHEKYDDDPAIAMPDLTTGKADEECSLRMNDVVTDVEAAFDDIYIAYPRHKQMQLAIDQIRKHGIKVRGTGKPMRGLLVVGPPGSGKTTGIEEYVAYLVKEGAYAHGHMPILYLRLRKKVTVIKLLRAILAKFGDRYIRNRDDEELHEQVRNCIERAGVQVIVIDECQHLRNKSTDNLEVTDQLKTFLDDSIAPVVFSGIDETKKLFNENTQLATRCGSPIELNPLDSTNETDVELITKFLTLLDDEIVKRKLISRSSLLGSAYTVACLHLASRGVIGQAYRIVRAALLIATSRGALYVETYDLSLAVERWAIRNNVCTSNPFLRSDLRAAFPQDAE